MFIGRTDTEAETPILWPPHAKSWLIGKEPNAGRDWGAGREGNDRGWGGWMASPTRWTWVCVNSRSLWWTGRPGVLLFMGSQRVGHDWLTELADWLNDYHMWYLSFFWWKSLFLSKYEDQETTVTSKIIEIIFLDSGIDFGMGILSNVVISDSGNYPKCVLKKMHWYFKEMGPWQIHRSRPQKEGENVANDTQIKIRGKRQK